MINSDESSSDTPNSHQDSIDEFNREIESLREFKVKPDQQKILELYGIKITNAVIVGRGPLDVKTATIGIG